MSQIYTSRKRENDPHALPNAEVFRAAAGELTGEDGEPREAGWYWWACFPGCLPDGEADGPYETEQAAIDAARDDDDPDDEEIDPGDPYANRAEVLETLRAMFEHAGSPNYRAEMRAALKLGSWEALDERIKDAKEAAETLIGD